MSGIEIAGLLLGAFPLLISAMEHYEETTKVAKAFWRIKRTHRRDLDKIKDCQMNLRLTLKQLLLPLLRDEIVARAKCEELLADPGGPGWREGDVEEALAARLDECHERCLGIMRTMMEIMAALCEATRVDDSKFQERIAKQRNSVLTSKANDHFTGLAFQGKRLIYVLTSTRREDLLNDLERQNRVLDELLAKSDKISAITTQSTPPSLPRISSKALDFCKHADSMYRVIRSAWKCSCRSYANLLLQHPIGAIPCLDFFLNFCHGSRCIRIRLDDSPPTIQLRAIPKASQLATASGNRSALKASASHTAPRTSAGTLAAQGSSSARASSTNSVSTTTSVQTSSIATSSAVNVADLERDGLCKTLASTNALDASLGRILDDHSKNEYVLAPAQDRLSGPTTSRSLEAALVDPVARMSRVERYRIALTLASSHLQLHSTPWMRNHLWRVEDVQLRRSSSTASQADCDPCITTRFDKDLGPQPIQKDHSFSTLGIVLLELCFGKRLEDHELWQQPAYAALKQDHMIRRMVACEWLEEIQGEAGGDYANAVDWTLRQAPTTSTDGTWRKSFAGNVVQHLQRCYDSMMFNQRLGKSMTISGHD